MAARPTPVRLAGADGIFDAVMRQCGVLRAESLDEAFNWCTFLSVSPRPKDGHAGHSHQRRRIGVLATTRAEKYGIELYDKPGDY